MSEFPNISDVVICKITKITDYGVFVTLLEYDNLEAFVHVSQVSSTWVKNIHNHVKLNQIRAGKVLHIDKYKNQIDLSFNRVTPAEEKRKISDYRLFKRAQGLLSVVAKELSITEEEMWKGVAEPILEKENSLYNGLLNIVKHGQNYYAEIDKKYREKLIEILTKSITIKDKKINAILEISNDSENGIELVKSILLKTISDNKNTDITYLSAGKYEMSVIAKDFKTASKKINEIIIGLEKGFKNFNFKYKVLN